MKNYDENTQAGSACRERLVLDSRVLQERNHDRYTQEWGEWEDVEGRKLREKFGATPEDWKRSCKMWIEVGGRYEFRMFRRVDTEEWSMCFSSENSILSQPDREQWRYACSHKYAAAGLNTGRCIKCDTVKFFAMNVIEPPTDGAAATNQKTKMKKSDYSHLLTDKTPCFDITGSAREHELGDLARLDGHASPNIIPQRHERVVNARRRSGRKPDPQRRGGSMSLEEYKAIRENLATL